MAKGSEEERTAREQLRELLKEGPFTAKEISAELGIAEDRAVDHLQHIARSSKNRGEKLVIEPAECRKCGFTFSKRERFTKPGKCPECRATFLAPPAFRIVES